MRVLQVINSLNPEMGGPAAMAMALAECLHERGIESDLVTLDPPGSPWNGGVRAKVFELGHMFSKGAMLFLVETPQGSPAVFI